MKNNMYACDPNKNVNCKKNECYINGGSCRTTLKEECQMDQNEKKQTTSIGICQHCQGSGGMARYSRKEKSTCTDCDVESTCARMDDDGCSKKKVSNFLVRSVCPRCKGSGRVQITFIEEPYVPRGDGNE